MSSAELYDPPQCAAVVNYPPPTTRGNCSGLTIACTPPSGSSFPVGTTVVTCTATDANGVLISTCNFSVTINCPPCAEDVEPPAVDYVTVKPFQTYQAPVLRRVGQFQLQISDNCDPDALIFIQDSVSGFVAGPFHHGDQVEIAKGPGLTPEQAVPPTGPNVALIRLRSGARMFGVDSSGNTSPLKKVL